MEATSIIALLIILGLGYWFNSSREEKRRQQEAVIASQKASKKTQARHDNRTRARIKARNAINSRAADFDVEYSSDQMNWILDRAEVESGEKGLADITHIFATASRDVVEKLIVEVEKSYLMYQVDLRFEQESVESERQWQAVLDDFKRLNPAQQKSHLAYIKKHHTGELTDEQLHILELVSLGEVNTPKSKDIEVGGVKLFTLKEK